MAAVAHSVAVHSKRAGFDSYWYRERQLVQAAEGKIADDEVDVEHEIACMAAVHKVPGHQEHYTSADVGADTTFAGVAPFVNVTSVVPF